MLSFEFSGNEKLHLHGDREGLLQLADILIHLAKSEEPDHVHLMSPELGGAELSDGPQGLDKSSFKHVKVCVWLAEDK
ncbi:Imm32 family immunity protein [Solimonas sp. SE-A11]|uniref:Imm32 family immunity protein n=1 Tax=Solimonas sp. SE-A11 TaxID=3054954 RepID=UPI00259D1FBA|nr:Imm32 family immunity protein [Solimonas sp. SE-A11]MDM4773069.1 Imm32 family immunity protein [Solimonas sp. SE-A11]